MPAAIQRKKEGFQGQKAIVIPRKILSNRCAGNEILGKLYITDIGYYPKARFHYRERPHGADQQILIYCREGAGEVTIKKNRYAISAGEFFIVPAKTAHTYAAGEKDPWTIYWLHFKGNTAASLLSLIQEKLNGYKGLIEYGEPVIRLFDEIYSQFERGYGNDQLLYANMSLWHFLASFIYNNRYDTTGRSYPKSKDTADIAIDFLSKHIDQSLTLGEMAAAVNLAPSYFSALFRKKTGFTPIEYFNHLKVQKACQYLLFTSLRIKEIALELGIEDQLYFSRMFSKVMGISPNEYREKRIH